MKISDPSYNEPKNDTSDKLSGDTNGCNGPSKRADCHERTPHFDDRQHDGSLSGKRPNHDFWYACPNMSQTDGYPDK